MVRGGNLKPFDTTGNEAETASLNHLRQKKRKQKAGYINVGLRTAQALADGGVIPTSSDHTPLPTLSTRDQRGNSVRLGRKALDQISKLALERRKEALSSETAKTRERLDNVANHIRINASGVEESFAHTNDSFDYFDIPVDDYQALAGDDGEQDHKEYVRYIDIVETLHGPAAVGRRRRHTQSRREKKISRQAKWDDQEDLLATTLLEWMHSLPAAYPDHHDIDFPIPQPASDSHYFTVGEVCGYHWFRKDWAIPHVHTQYPAQSLVAIGLIPNSPDHPNWAVSIRTLQQYHQMRLIKPNTGIQAFVRAMCLAQGRSSTTSLIEKFSEAFDIYLSLIDRLDDRLSVELGRDAPSWRLENFCPACTEHVDGEEELKYQFIFSMDGGSSAKRWADAGRANGWRVFERDKAYRLTPEQVNKWKDVVKKRKVKKKKKSKDDETDDDTDNDSDIDPDDCDAHTEVIEEVEYVVKNVQGDPTDGGDKPTECTKNFKAAAEDSKKGMFSCFEEAGIFVAVCKHGALITYCDMICSSELAKYPLALVDIIQKLHGHKHFSIGYDIWCSFCKTLETARILDNPDGTTLAMHGYAHGRLCQLKDLPLYKTALGLADCEQCERWFSASNLLAGVTRHASKFHRHQALKMHAQQSNSEKAENLGKYIYNNYKQAHALIDELLPIMNNANRERGLNPEDFLRMHQDELAYLKSLKKEPDEDSLKCTYVDTLHKLWDAQELERQRLSLRGTATTATNARAMNKRRSPISLSAIMAETEQFLERCGDLEMQLGIDIRWTKEDSEYLDAKKYNDERQYRIAAMEVKMLVTQRFMEMAKCHMRGTNYKVRTNIAKHLQTRSKTIQKAVAKLNCHGRDLGKPNVPIKEVLREQFLEDFHLMEALGDDVRMKDWAKRDVRVLRDQFFKLRCAQTELQILRVEYARVEKWMESEKKVHLEVINRLAHKGMAALARYAQAALDEHKRKCTTITHWLAKCPSLKTSTVGSYSQPQPRTSVGNHNGEEGDGIREEDEEEEGELEDAMDDMHQILTNMERHG